MLTLGVFVKLIAALAVFVEFTVMPAKLISAQLLNANVPLMTTES